MKSERGTAVRDRALLTTAEELIPKCIQGQTVEEACQARTGDWPVRGDRWCTTLWVNCEVTPASSTGAWGTGAQLLETPDLVGDGFTVLRTDRMS